MIVSLVAARPIPDDVATISTNLSPRTRDKSTDPSYDHRRLDQEKPMITHDMKYLVNLGKFQYLVRAIYITEDRRHDGAPFALGQGTLIAAYRRLALFLRDHPEFKDLEWPEKEWVKERFRGIDLDTGYR
ncbi:hypothetical protein FRC03_005953 [Tulasnella sp. 419]|nr:hypothetical protein FRC03_005953 [Tulasnella sp. 419]